MRKNLFILCVIALFAAARGYAQTTPNLVFSYQIASTPAVTIGNGGTVVFPDTSVGAGPLTQVIFNITNNGTGAVNISGIAATNTAVFQVTPTSSLNLPVNGTTQLTLTFAPTVSGPATATLSFVGNASTFTFGLSGKGVGPLFINSYSIDIVGNQVPLNNGDTITFPTIPANASSTATISIANTGTGPGTLTDAVVFGGAYRITGKPLVPAQIAANGTVTFRVVFTTSNNHETGTLVITLGTTVLTVNLTGTPPIALPSYTFTGSAGSTANPLDQPTVGIHLSAKYPANVDITGSLTLTFVTSAFVNDPTIQFSSGGQNVSFRIPAGTLDAIFQSGGTTVGFQAGTVAGVITVTPAFQAAQVDVTPVPVVAKSVTIGATAPVVRTVQIGTRTASTFEVLITGFSTPRSVTQINLQFTGAAGANLQTTSLSVNSDAAFTAWYQTAASQAVGSQFTVSLTITVNGNMSAVQSVAATLVNSAGTSNSVSASLQ